MKERAYGPCERSMPCESVKIIEPIDGAILNRNDGKQGPNGLEVIVRGVAPEGAKVTVNDIDAQTIRGGCGFYDEFTCSIDLVKQENSIVARAESGGKITTDVITALWDRNSLKRYRFSTDDNIVFLKDLALNASKYSSIFDNEYLAFWREMHEKYGARVQFNTYYQTEGFNLSQMPDKYRPEWEENADWMRLTFHALQNDPPNPYIGASYQVMLHDFSLVTGEIARFAGRRLLSPFTTVHWGEATLEACKALRNQGMKGLVGYFLVDPGIGRPIVSYYLDHDRTMYLNARDYWKDTREDLFFIKHDLVINLLQPKDIAPTLNSIASNPHKSHLMEVMIHEQYFNRQYPHYEPDAHERVITTLEWLRGNGYRSVFYEEGFLGSPP
jgi:hypothetical protein